VEEATRNAVRHGAVTRLEIAVAFADDCLRLRVSDDGRGFDAASVVSSSVKGHYGLLTMRERAIEVGGRLLVDSAPGSGTQITAEFPLIA
jgi:signal transduction histidine kinase